MNEIKSEKAIRSALYIDDDGNQLFVPPPRLWHFRNSQEPKQVRKRGGVAKRAYDSWLEKYGSDHWLFKRIQLGSAIYGPWLWGGDPPPNTVVVPPSRQTTRGPCENEFYSDREMIDFRQATTIEATSRAIESSLGTGETFSPVSVKHWIDAYEESGVDWVRSWLLFREDAPAHVNVATLREVEAVRAAWNYGSFRETGNGYVHIVDRLPSDDLHVFLCWLYGGEKPPGWYIMPTWVSELMNEMSPRHFCELANASITTFEGWNADPLKRAAFDEIRKSVDRGHDPKCDSEVFSKLKERYAASGKNGAPNNGSFNHMRKVMIRLAKVIAWKAALGRLEPQRSEGAWYDEREKAKAIGGDALAERLFQVVESGRSRKHRWGVLDRGIFEPSELLREFRDFTRNLRTVHRISKIENRCPAGCVRLWFLDWALPAAMREDVLVEDGPIVRSAEQPDGPIADTDGFRWKGRECYGLKGLARPLVRFLWSKPEYDTPAGATRRSALFDELSDPLYGDGGREVKRSMFKNPQREANRFFRDNGIPITVGSEAEGRSGVLSAYMEISEKS